MNENKGTFTTMACCHFAGELCADCASAALARQCKRIAELEKQNRALTHRIDCELAEAKAECSTAIDDAEKAEAKVADLKNDLFVTCPACGDGYHAHTMSDIENRYVARLRSERDEALAALRCL